MARPLLVTLALLASACSASAPAPSAGDGRISCTGPVVCDGVSVRACRMGFAAEVLDTCATGLTCSLGRCTSPACATTEGDPNSPLGCAFYTFDLDNVTSDDPLPTSVLVTNPGQTALTATLERRDGPGATWTSVADQKVLPHLAARFVLPDAHFEGGGLAARGAFRLTSTLPISAAHVQSDDSTPAGSSSSGATALLPAHILGQRYRAVTYGQVGTPAILAEAGSRNGAGQLVLVGAVDGTNVTISPSPTANLAPGMGTQSPGADGKIHLTLDEGDLFTLYSDRDGADLTGTEIAGDEPFAAFSGNISTTYGITADGVSSPDLAHEQLMPVSLWDTVYVAAHLAPQAGVCDPLLSPAGSSIWTIVADRDGTDVHFAVPPGLAQPSTRTLSAGESFHVALPGDFVVTALGGPIEVMQGIDCEPSLSSAVPTASWIADTYFAVLPHFDTEITIVRRTGQATYLDGAVVAKGFAPAGADFEVAHLPVAPCPTAAGVCTHHLEGRFGFSMRGMDVLTSYALTAPTWPCQPGGVNSCVN